MSNIIYLDKNHTLRFFSWSPDRELNPQYDGIPDDPKNGAIIAHKNSQGEYCEGAIRFDTETNKALGQEKVWKVESWEPLTLSPSLLCHCGDHGFIREGKWVSA